MNERELNYPIKFVHRDHVGKEDDYGYGIITHAEDGVIHVTYPIYEDEDYVNTAWTVEDAKRFISQGFWIVKSSGEPPEASPEASKDICTLAINVEAKEATAAVEALTQALLNCAKAYQHLKNVLGN